MSNPVSGTLETTEWILLLVEDNPADVFLLQRAFEDAGVQWTTVVAGDGERAINMLQEGSVRPTHIILDWKIPLRPGKEVLAWIRTHSAFRSTPVIVLTSSQVESDKMQASLLGIDAYFTKPFDSRERAALVRRIAELWNLPRAGQQSSSAETDSSIKANRTTGAM